MNKSNSVLNFVPQSSAALNNSIGVLPLFLSQAKASQPQIVIPLKPLSLLAQQDF